MKDALQTTISSYMEGDKVVIPKGIDLKPETMNRILQEERTEARRIFFAFLMKLMKEYNYKEDQLVLDLYINNTRVDMVVYRDQKHKEPFAIVLLTDSLKNETVEKAELLARQINSEYFVLRDKSALKFFKVQKNGLTQIDDLPFWVKNTPLKSRIPRSKTLPPFRDEFMLRRIIFKCHTIMLENLGHDPSKAFDEFIKIIFLKFFDEQSNSEENYSFMVHEGERPEDVKRRIIKLLEHAKALPIFSKIYNSSSVDIEINDFALYQIILELQAFSFIETMKTIDGIDIMGRIYEQIVGRTFRGGLGQYYTPRTMTEFMVDFLDVSLEERVLDPACGTGGFLMMCINHILKKRRSKGDDATSSSLLENIRDYIDTKLYGNDIYDRACRVARMNLIFHGGRDPKIFNMNGLLIDECATKECKDLFRENSFQKIFSNPPFAGIVKDPEILAKFELGKRNGNISSVSPEVLFIEKIVKLLDYGGQAGLVLPLGIFNNPSLKFAREFLYKNTKILGVIGLPDFAFTHTGTSVKGALLFIEKVKNTKKDYDVFMAVANNIGYDATGRFNELNDFPRLIEAYKNQESGYFINFSGIKDRLDPNYYLTYHGILKDKIAKTEYPIYSIFDLVEFSNERANPRKDSEKEFSYIETGSVNLKEGRIVGVKKFLGRKAPSRAKYIGRAGDILIPTARESLIGVLMLPKKYDGIIVSSRFIVCRPKEELVHRSYLYYLLKNKTILELLKRECVGEIVPSISESSLKNVRVPIPPLQMQKEMVSKIKEKRTREKEVKRELLVLRKQIEKMVKSLF
jgi:type I restriction enzyme M protein